MQGRRRGEQWSRMYAPDDYALLPDPRERGYYAHHSGTGMKSDFVGFHGSSPLE